jgi:3-hydroxyacyl-CoA dehydrogenase
MGHGIAQVFAQGGFKSPWWTRHPKPGSWHGVDPVESGNPGRTWVVDDPVEAVLDRIHCTTSLPEGAAGVDIAIEAASESPAVKKEIFSRLGDCCPPTASWPAIHPF